MDSTTARKQLAATLVAGARDTLQIYYDVIRHEVSRSESDQDMVLQTALVMLEQAVRLEPANAEYASQLAVLYHNERNLKLATRYFRLALELEPPRSHTAAELTAIERHAPICLVHRTEPLPLKDCVAIHHPDQPLIGYHFFWEDDYDFPDDDEPCDHEVMWVGYKPETGEVNGVYTYWHQTILTSAAAVAEARTHGARPLIRVQWGKHGSLPAGWEELTNYTGRPVIDGLREDHANSVNGGREKDHPLKRNWPKGFDGSFAEYCTLDREVQTLPLLREKRSYGVCRWANAMIKEYFLPYNFHSKREWPTDPNLNL